MNDIQMIKPIKCAFVIKGINGSWFGHNARGSSTGNRTCNGTSTFLWLSSLFTYKGKKAWLQNQTIKPKPKLKVMNCKTARKNLRIKVHILILIWRHWKRYHEMIYNKLNSCTESLSFTNPTFVLREQKSLSSVVAL